MKIAEAKSECEQWLAYLASQEEKSREMQRLASDRRLGLCNEAEARGRLSTIDRSIVVYDGARLADAVRCLLKAVS